MAPITDDQYVITDPETGRRRWIHPEDDPPPPKAGPDGNMSPAYVAWEVRRSERRMRGEDPRRPMSEPLPMSPLDVELAELDAKIVEAAEVAEGFGRRKVATRNALAAASKKAEGASSAGRYAGVATSRPDVELIRRLKGELDYLTERLAEARAIESTLRGLRNTAASPIQRRPDSAIPYHPGWNATWNDDVIVDGKRIKGPKR